jgi:tetratricopeptide (TPR) repeat protein
VGRKSRAKRKSTEAPAASETGSASQSRGRRIIFWIVALLLPLVVLVAIELALRATGYGRDLEPLFVPAPQQPAYLQANPGVVTRFFTDVTQAPRVSIETAYFPAQKAPGTFRVFVQGESSAAGFPYGLGAALAGVLDQRLERAFPSREIEVISTALAAVNSYALVDFADEIIAHQPDAVLVYVGHNEFLGILGVGSSLRMAATPWMTRAFLAVRELRLFQLMSNAYRRFAAEPAALATDAQDSLMARVAGERVIVLSSNLFRRGVEQFEANLGRLLAKYREAGIPVFVGTLVSNERDQPPLAILANVGGEAAGAAQTAYYAAQDAEAAGGFEAAREGYAWARDLDPLRFRAPAAFGDVIARVAAAHDAEIVDVRRAFSDASPNGLVGASLLLEHVHPNLDGYFLLADAFFDALLARGLPGRPEIEVTEAEARADMPVSDVDRYLGDYKVLRIKAGWPFAAEFREPSLPPPANEAQRLAQALFHERISWPDAQNQLRAHAQAAGDVEQYASITAMLADAFPFVGQLQFETAAARMRQARPQDALRYSRRGIELEPRSANQWLVHAHALFALQRADEGRAALGQVLAIDPANPTARQVLGELEGR